MTEAIVEGFHLSPRQKWVWRTEQENNRERGYVHSLIHVTGVVDLACLRDALTALTARHEPLRTTFQLLRGMSVPLQVIAEQPTLSLVTRDLCSLSHAQQEACLQEFLQDAQALPLDEASGSLARFALFTLQPQQHQLVMILPALCADTASLVHLFEGLCRAYQGDDLFDGDDDELPYTAVAEWQTELLESEEAEEGRAYWHQQPSHAMAHLPYITAASKDVPFSLARLPILVQPSTAAKLRTLSRQTDISISTLLLAAWKALLWHLTRDTNITIGVAHHGRHYEELRSIVGPLTTYLPISSVIDGQQVIQQLATNLAEQLAEVHDYQEYFFWSDYMSLNPSAPPPTALFEHVTLPNSRSVDALSFTLEEVSSWPDPSWVHLRYSEQSLSGPLDEPHDLSFSCTFSYDTARFTPQAAERLCRQFDQIVERIANDPTRLLDQFSLLDRAEQEKLLVAFNQTAQPYPSDLCLHQLFAAQVEKTPDAIAIHSAQGNLTFQELDRAATMQAAKLRQFGVGADMGVALYCERSSELIIGMLAVLKAGAAYLPLDITLPRQRIEFMLRDTRVPVLLTQDHLQAQLTDCPVPLMVLDAKALCQETSTSSQKDLATGDLEFAVHPDNLAYIIYTSGSTGQPKGVMVSHRSVANYVSWAINAYEVANGVGSPVHSPPSFDLTVTAIFPALLSGKCLTLLPDEANLDALSDALQNQSEFSLVKLTPAHLAILRHQLTPEQLASQSQHLIVGGEALTMEAIRGWLDHAPEVRIVNEYGPTEATVGCCVYTVPVTLSSDRAEEGAIPIGRPIANTQLYVLDESLQPLPIGVPGELYIGGVPLARGYLNRPGLTAERFFPDPFSTVPGSRLYRTGDLVCHRPDGELAYLGRLDQQIKIRGYRIEPGEIQATLVQHPTIAESEVFVHQDEAGHKQLVAYYIAADDASADGRKLADDANVESGSFNNGRAEIVALMNLREHLSEKLPAYMMPSSFVRVPAWPLTTNGKLDRDALPAPDSATLRTKEQAYVAPRNDLEELLTSIIAQVVGSEKVGIDDNFFAWGGDSIRTIQVAALAQSRGLRLNAFDLFQHQTIRELAVILQQSQGASTEQLVETAPFSLISEQDKRKLPAGLEDAYPVTALQAGMFFHTEAASGSAIYHDMMSICLKAPFDRAHFAQTLQESLVTHPVARTSFDFKRFSLPLQLVHTDITVPLFIEDWRHLPADKQDEQFAVWFEAEKYVPFNWGEAPLFRIYVHQRSADSFQFTFSFHHAMLDGWSVATVITDVFERYITLLDDPAAAALGRPMETTFRDFVGLEQAAVKSTETQTYWRTQIADAALLSLPSTRNAANAKPDTASELSSEASPSVHSFPIAASLSQAIQQFAKESALPIKSLLLAAHLYVLHSLSGQSDVVTGLVTHGRPEAKDGDKILGLFLNTLPLRMKLIGGSWRQLIQDTFDLEWEMYPHRRYPLVYLQRALGGEALFTTAFNFMHFHVYDEVKMPGDIEVIGEPVFFEQTNFSLMAYFSLNPVEGDVRFSLNYDGVLFSRAQIESIGQQYLAVLQAMVEQPDANYAAFSLLPPEDRRLMQAWNDTAMVAEPLPGFHHLVETTAQATPNAIAVQAGEQTLTYAQLESQANQLAHHLQALGAKPEAFVGVCMTRVPEMIVGLLAILKSGAAYVPLDPAYPAKRLAFIMEDAQADILLTQEAIRVQTQFPCSHVICVDAEWPQICEQPTAPVRSSLGPDNLAYVLYTSGSTGRPKGVAITHGNVLAMLQWGQRTFSPELFRQSAAVTSINFDLSVFEIFLPLSQGGTVMLANNALHLVEMPGRESLTLINTVPSAIAELLKVGGVPSTTRVVNLAGEPLPRPLVDQIYAQTQVEAVYNLYGPSEDTTYSTFALIPRDTDEKPLIGRPIDNTVAYVLNTHMQPVPVGVIGELYLGGAGVARGYLGQAAMTAERFVPDPLSEQPGARLYRTGDLVRYAPDGSLEFLGRADHQIKLRGYRIELGEIEAMLLRHPAVDDCAVLVRDDAFGYQQLVAYVAPHEASCIAEGARPLYSLPHNFEVAYQSKIEVEHIYEDIFERHCYLQHGLTIEEGDCIVDVGGNIGLFALYAHHQNPNVTIYGFEPIPALYEIYSFNTAQHGVNVRAFNYGLSDVEKSTTITFYPNSSGMSSIYPDEVEEKDTLYTIMQNQLEDGLDGMAELMPYADDLLEERFQPQVVSCRLSTLSHFMAEHEITQIDFLKIDVQKSELDVLNGIAPQDWPRIKQIALEVHDIEGRLANMEELLHTKGYAVSKDQDPHMRGTSLYNLYARRTDFPKAKEVPVSEVRTHWLTTQLDAALRTFVDSRLPYYMAPAQYVLIPALPLTPNGKIDRQKLTAAAMDEQAPRAITPPANRLEAQLAEVWQEFLPVNEVGMEENIFELGGHSLILLQIHVRLGEVLEQELSIVDLFTYTTIRSLADYLQTQETDQRVLDSSIDRATRRKALRRRRASSTET